MSLLFRAWNARTRPLVRQTIAVVLALQMVMAAPAAAFADEGHDRDRNPDRDTRTPFKHVIVIIGENRSFDHVFATYTPRRGQTISNLLSEHIINADGTPGPNFARTAQSNAVVNLIYDISPTNKTPFSILPPAMTDGANTVGSDTNPPPFATLAVAQLAETDLTPATLPLLLTGATGLAHNAIDTRLNNVNNLPNGVFQLTNGIPYDAYTGDMVHRFYQMWQQYDCNVSHATRTNPSGCIGDLIPFVETTVGTGSAGRPQPANFNQLSTGEGSNGMSFENVQQGDAPLLKSLADQFTMSDNFHQSVMGGTMVQHHMLGYADLLFFSDGTGNATVPPPVNGQSEIKNPNPQPGTNNFYVNDGGVAIYSNCSDTTQPGVAPIVDFLQRLPRRINPNCAQGHFYGLDNQNPGFNEDGTLAPLPAVPPSNVRHIGDELMERGISFVYYGGQWDRAVAHLPNAYCNICNPFQYASDIMSDPVVRNAHIKDTTDLHVAIANGTLPAIAYVKPDGLLDGHPASSKLDLFEAFSQRIISELQANPKLWNETAVFLTFDEGGGQFDSGYIQPLDFFGDGPRIPLIVVSPFSRGGKITHSYADHVSILKFIERNWNLKPITNRSRDNFPNPVASRNNPYVPLNSPAIGDLFDMFNFDHGDRGDH
jgi:phospholipase C